MNTSNNRKPSFQQDIRDRLNQIPGRSPSYRAYLQRTAHSNMNDLTRLGILPFKLKNLTADRVEALVSYWKQTNRSAKTIMNRLTVIRMLAVPIPNNKELGIICVPKVKDWSFLKIKIDPDLIQIEEVKHICLLQLFFGLKKTEAIHASSLLAKSDVLIVPRSISHNRKEHRIAIDTSAQRDLIKRLQKSRWPARVTGLSFLHRTILHEFKVTDSEYFRYQYIINRFEALSLKTSSYQAARILRREVGHHLFSQMQAGALL